MADSGRRRISGRRTSSSRTATISDTSSPTVTMGKSTKERKPKKMKERWLLTRKTWRYMADAGRKLIPDGALNRPEDVPKIEAYFQEVCQKEPRFLLWRKSSYPGALAFRSHRRQRNRKGGSCRTKSNSADECDELARKKEFLLAQHTSGGRFDIKKMKQDFFNRPVQSTPYPSPFTKRTESGIPTSTLPMTREEDDDENQLIEMLADYLRIQENKSGTVQKNIDKVAGVEKKTDSFDYQTLVEKLQQHLELIYGPRTPSTSAAASSSFPSSTSTTQTISSRGRTNVEFEGDHIQKSLLETISRYYSRSPNRERVVSDILTDRKLLEKLYFDLRQTKGFRSSRSGTSGLNMTKTSPKWRSSLKRYDRDDYSNDNRNVLEQEGNGRSRYGNMSTTSVSTSSASRPLQEQDLPRSPPPLIAIHSESIEVQFINEGVQTDSLTEQNLNELEIEYKKAQNANKDDDIKSPPRPATPRRKSSLDNDDVSQSVSDTIKRYLRMARKKSVDADKVDRFKRVNYDKNLRFIKAKGETTKPGDDDGLNKGCQTNDDWITIYRDLKFDDYVYSEREFDESSRVTSSRSSFDGMLGEDLLSLNPNPSKSPTPQTVSMPASPSGIIASGQSFLSHLLHGKQHHHADKQSATQQQQNANNAPTNNSSHPVTAGAAAAMQKSKSSSSVMHHGSRLVAKKIWRSRSKSQTRATQNATLMWTPQGQCTWTNVTGRQVALMDTSLIQLSEVERRVLQKVALAKLQAMNLGASVRLPTETMAVSSASKPKRRAYLLKRKALTTSFFDNSRVKDGDKEKGSSVTGLVFGIPLNQCIENDRIARLARGGSPFRSRSDDETPDLRRHGSRTSFSSLIDTTGRAEEGSCESLMSRERIGASVPGLLDALSSSTSDLGGTATPSSDDEPGVPNMVNACLRHLETHGLHTLGIFRVSSSKKRVRQLREDFDSGKETIIGDDQCPHDVATLLKEYLRDLPDPLLCRELYHAFVHTQKVRNRRLQFEAIQYLVQLLPAANRDTLFALMNFLSSVARFSGDQKDSTGEWIPGNKMDSNNLATVFAPNILHCVKAGVAVKESGPERAEERIDVINVIRSMIDHNRQLFQVSAELLDEVYTILMETNPEALNQLLDKKESTMIGDEILYDLESESSTPRTPNTPRMTDDHTLGGGADSDGSGRQTPKKFWSREEFLHGTAGMGGPNLAMKIRHKEKERARDRFSKRRWHDDSLTRRQISIEDNNNTAYDLVKSRSSSMDSGTVTGERLRVTEEQRYSTTSSTSVGVDSRRQSTPSFLDDTNIITASLKIPLQPSNSSPHCINLDDYTDIPYIEDTGGYTVITTDGKQQMPIGILRSGGPTVPPRRRQRSASGSDSSQASIGQQQVRPVTASLNLVQTGYDSAVGSSATFSSPPRNTPSSVGSSVAGDGLLSSPPSWASTPPTSPDSTDTTVNYIPDDGVRQTTIYSRMMVPIKQQSSKTESVSTSGSSAILQKVTFTSETSQKSKQVETRAYKRETSTVSTTYRREVSTTSSTGEAPVKSASTSAVPQTTKSIGKPHEKEHKFSPSISSIGGAVLRSRTADFERMFKSGHAPVTEPTSPSSTAVSKTKDISTTTSSDKKKYVKRRYTDSRHNTRHIPDSNALESGDVDVNATRTAGGSSGSVSRASNVDQTNSQTQLPIYKRRELIASVPKEKRSFF